MYKCYWIYYRAFTTRQAKIKKNVKFEQVSSNFSGNDRQGSENDL